MMNKIIPNVLLIGCGPHARRVYLPFLKETELKYGTQIKAIVELKDKQNEIENLARSYYKDVQLFFVDPFGEEFKHSLPCYVEIKLNELVENNNINCVIIATDPLNHMQYALWAEKKGLHILMDKPISTYKNISNSEEQAKQLKYDYELLLENYLPDKAFIINVQRRYLNQFEIIQNKINEVASNYGMPVTSMQSMHSDGQWRLPNEVLTFNYHPHLGWGKVSHSGYHFIDMASKIMKDSFVRSGKIINKLSVFTQFIRPQGVFKLQSQKDLLTIFGEKYNELDSRSDSELADLFHNNNEAEVDAFSLIGLWQDDILVANITLNLIHNGFSRRSWMISNDDLYKGNGRVRHEYHNIEQGPFQNIQIHSYQVSDEHHDKNTIDDFSIGGNNHYEVHIYRNTGIIGGKELEIITAKDIATNYKLDFEKSMNVLARQSAISEFLEIVLGKRRAQSAKGNLVDSGLSAQLMSMIYESGIKKIEIQQPIHNSILV